MEQQFSDEDIFEDSDKEDKTPASSKRKKARKSTGIVTTGVMESGMSFERAKPVYTERGYDASLPPIRERFTFEPEYEDDGTPKIELIVGRRLIEDTKDRQNYDDDEENESGDDDDSDAPRASRSKSKSKNSSEDDDDDEVKADQTEMDYEYLLKYKGRSYLHLEWKSAADLESMGKVAKTIYRRFLKKLEAGTEEDLEDPTVDPSYTEPGRILAEEEHEIMVEMTNKELAKWQKENGTGIDETEEDSEEEKEVAPQAKPEESMEEEKKEEKEPVGKCSNVNSHLLSNSAISLGMISHPLEIKAPEEMTLEDLRRVVANGEPYYPPYPGSDNPYRDGYYTEVSLLDV